MELDEQLAALAAGELDDDTARALRARAAADPAIARRLARHQQLQQQLEEWDAPAMSAEAVARLEDRVDEALAALDDAPLADERVVGLPPRPLVDTADAADEGGAAGGAPGTGDGRVVDLGEARRRRGLPSWVPGAAVAAALAAVVGTGIVIGGLPGGADLDMMAEEGPEQVTDDAGEDASTDAPAEAEMFDDGSAGREADAGGGPMRRSGIDLAEGDLLALVATEAATSSQLNGGTAADGDTATGDDTASDDTATTEEAAEDQAAITAPADAPCVTEALERDTTQADGREVWLVGDGTYAGEPAVFVVIRAPATPEDRFEVLAYDPAGCDLLARDETTR